MLGRGIGRRALKLVVPRSAVHLGYFSRQAKISQHEHVVRPDHEIRRLHIQMDDVGASRVFQRCDRLLHEPHRVRDGKNTSGQNPILQRLALDVAHGQIRHALLLAGGVKRHDVHVPQARNGPRFLKEIGHHFRTAEIRPVHDLDGHVPFQRWLDRLEHLAHAALAQLFEDQVGADLAAGRKKLLGRVHGPGRAKGARFTGRLGSTRWKNNTSAAADYLMAMNLLATVLDSEHPPAVCPTCSASST